MNIQVTLTGADERTDLDKLVEMVRSHSTLEVGLLYTATPEGRPRYPTLTWLCSAAARLEGRCAIHVCGRGARQQLLAGELKSVVKTARRVQVNGLVHSEELRLLAARVPVLITQHNDWNAALAQADGPANHQILVDGSGGRGLSPAEWSRPDSEKSVGFAGGLGADNIQNELPRIREVAKGEWWIDLEGKLRTDDWFDLAKCEAFLKQIA